MPLRTPPVVNTGNASRLLWKNSLIAAHSKSASIAGFACPGFWRSNHAQADCLQRQTRTTGSSENPPNWTISLTSQTDANDPERTSGARRGDQSEFAQCSGSVTVPLARSVLACFDPQWPDLKSAVAYFEARLVLLALRLPRVRSARSANGPKIIAVPSHAPVDLPRLRAMSYATGIEAIVTRVMISHADMDDSEFAARRT